MKMLRTTMLGVITALAMCGAAQAGSVTVTGPTTKVGTLFALGSRRDRRGEPLARRHLWWIDGCFAVGAARRSGRIVFDLAGLRRDHHQHAARAQREERDPPLLRGRHRNRRLAIRRLRRPDRPELRRDRHCGLHRIPERRRWQLATPQFVVPGGPAGSALTSLASLQLLAFPAMLNGAGGQSTTVALSGNVTMPGAYTLSMLQNNFTPVQQTVSGDTYTGNPLLTFINTTSANINTQIVVGRGPTAIRWSIRSPSSPT